MKAYPYVDTDLFAGSFGNLPYFYDTVTIFQKNFTKPKSFYMGTVMYTFKDFDPIVVLVEVNVDSNVHMQFGYGLLVHKEVVPLHQFLTHAYCEHSFLKWFKSIGGELCPDDVGKTFNPSAIVRPLFEERAQASLTVKVREGKLDKHKGCIAEYTYRASNTDKFESEVTFKAYHSSTSEEVAVQGVQAQLPDWFDGFIKLLGAEERHLKVSSKELPMLASIMADRSTQVPY